MRLFALRALIAFEQSFADPLGAQKSRLQRLLQDLQGTGFGEDHALRRGMSLEDWRASVPLRRHAELIPYLDRVAAGERQVLTRTPVLQLLETSGTTGKAKWLPVTREWARTVADAQRLWVLSLLRDDEGLAEGKALSIVSPAETGRSPGGLAIGSNTGRMFLAQPFWVRWRAPVPYPVYCLEQPELRAYVILRHALLQPIRSWTTANPSTILLYVRHLRRWWSELQADCAEGTLRRGPAAELDEASRQRLARGLKAGRLPEDPFPSRIWPLRRINCWTGGAAGFFLDRLPAALGAEVPVREVGITASEGYFAIPVDDEDPVAWLGGHLLEFLDESGKSHWAWEVETGKEYRLVISTEAGLYRYDLDDRVRVTGWLGPLPRLRFVGKVGNVLNATGEKVTEEQVASVARQVFGDANGVSLCLGWGEVPWFQVAVEGEGGSAESMDQHLQETNVEYASKRESGRLGPPQLHRLAPGRFAAYKAWRVQQGAPEAQVKDPWILDEERWKTLVEGRWTT